MELILDVFQYIETILQQVFSLKKDTYVPNIRYVKVKPDSLISFSCENDYYFLLDMFSSGQNPVNGIIISNNHAEVIDPLLLIRGSDLKPYFKGMLEIHNHDSEDTLYVKLLQIIPKSNQQ